MKKHFLQIGLVAGLFTALGCNKKDVTQNQTKADPASMKMNGSVILANSAPSAYGCFTISNVFSSKVLEVRGDTTLLKAQSNPKNVQQYTNFNSGFGSSQNQKWYLIQQNTGAITASTPFKIMNVASGLFLEVADANSGTQLFQDHANSFPSQIWYLHQVSGTSNYYIQNNNGLVLTDHASSTADGAPVTEETLANNNTQYWNLTSIAAEAYRDDQVVSFFRRTSGSISFDQGNSIPLTYSPNNGKVLWVGEDTFTQNVNLSNGTFQCGQIFDVRNSALIQPASHSWDPSQTSNLITHNSTYQYEILASPTTDHGGTYTWPGVGVEIGNHVYMYAFEQLTSSTHDVVIYDFTESSSGGLDWGTAVRHTVPGVSDQNNIGYAQGMVKPGDGFVYAYGTQGYGFGGNYVYVARFSTSTPFQWTFWNGSGWVSSPSTASAAQIAFNGQSDKGALTNVGVSFVNGKYVMVQMDNGYICNDGSGAHNIYMSTSSSPTGPFTARKQVYTIQDKINGQYARYYVSNIHPEFVNGHNELLMTYCLNYTGCNVSSCTNGRLDPYYYQVKAVRVPYAAIGL